jgi:hypothetical protein
MCETQPMRTLGFVIFLAACSSGSENTGPADSAAVELISMSCSTGVTDFCKTTACDQNLADAEKNAALCPASEITCGGYTVVLRVEGGVPTTYYYQAGALVAVAHPSQPGGAACLGGPAAFSAPKCVTAGRSLPVCTSGEPPTGW